jgi:hypothetical protein
MAKVKEITPEMIELMRGKIDFYMLRGILPVARSWPKKPKPPYTELQATGMAVFSMAASSMKRLSPKVQDAWKVLAVGRRSQWPDSYKAIALKYWKLTREFPLIAKDYEVIETATTVKVVWEILKLSLIHGVPEDIYNLETDLISKSDIEKAVKPIYFTLLDDSSRRQLAPFIKYMD